MKISISLPRNSYDSRLEYLLTKATEYYAKTIMSTRMANTLKLKVHVRKTVCGNDTYGQVISKVGVSRQKEFKIQLNANHDLHTMLDTLAHEMIHVKQFSRGELYYRRWKTDNQVHVMWNGEHMGPLDNIDYWDRPWEHEAKNNQRKYYKMFLEHVRSL